MITLSWQQPLWQELGQRLANDTLPHALLFHGAPGIGKQILVHRLVRLLLCQEPRAGDACGLCRSCRLSEPGGAHPDWVQVAPEEGKSAILVDQIRSLCASLALSAAFDGRRVGVITHADMMNTNAANALLKTLEEPGADVHLLLVADRPGRMPATIRSRCQPQFCPLPDHAVALEWLATESDADATLRAQALTLAGGGPLQALSWLQDGVVAEARQVAQDLQELSRSDQPDPVVVWQRWKEIPADRLWRWILLNLHQWARDLKTADGRSAQPVDLQRLLHLSAAAQQGLRLAATPVRDDLQIWQWLLQWIEPHASQVSYGAT